MGGFFDVALGEHALAHVLAELLDRVGNVEDLVREEVFQGLVYVGVREVFDQVLFVLVGYQVAPDVHRQDLREVDLLHLLAEAHVVALDVELLGVRVAQGGVRKIRVREGGNTDVAG